MNRRLEELRLRFRQRAQIQAGELERSLRDGDAPRLRDVAHKLSGGGGTFGYPEISRLADALEGAAELQATTAELAQAVQSLVDGIARLGQVV